VPITVPQPVRLSGSIDGAGVCARGGVNFAKPKSRILTWQRVVTKIFAGLMSRWMMPLLCAASSASLI